MANQHLLSPMPGPTAGARFYVRYEAVILGIIGLIVFAGLWEAAANLNWINPIIASSPTRIAGAFGESLRTGELLGDLGVSLREFLTGFLIASIAGVGVGLLMGLNLNVEYVMDPFVWFGNLAPLVAFYALFIVWLGFGFWTVVAIITLLTGPSIVVNTLAGVRSVDQSLVRVIRAFGGKNRDVVFKVLLPGAVPLILAGLRIGLGRALVGVIAGELFSSNLGLGYRISFYGAKLQTTNVFVSIITLVLLGVVLTQLLKLVEDRLLANRATVTSDLGG